MKKTVKDIVHRAWKQGLPVPAFNIPYLPMMKPIINALRDAGSFGLIAVARPEWVKFQARSLKAVADEYNKLKDEQYTRLHLDHVPVVDEDLQRVDFEKIFAEAIELGYNSIMVDGSRLAFKENVAATKKVAKMAQAAGIPLEAELGAVLGHEQGPLPSYDELFASGRGFTDPQEAKRFVTETGVNWLSVAVGNIHGAISGAAKDAKKVQARLNIERLRQIRDAANIPLVLHGGSGIPRAMVLEGVRNGIAKINVGMAIRQPYEQNIANGAAAAQAAVYHATMQILKHEFQIEASAERLN